ncbi:hypothetical protein SAMN00790413_02616 [Deinococcus hopiensis KR-140]|uniref:Uncharacterized protein n=1 Tax=Deinococcus hopiensis KR-140 TaxID=695939 RepID=A0A1W1VNQ1_9DEIO|nr:hypothetical protein SAMN00790413_02616 [Deinococcus hopiensis KR-140]
MRQRVPSPATLYADPGRSSPRRAAGPRPRRGALAGGGRDVPGGQAKIRCSLNDCLRLFGGHISGEVRGPGPSAQGRGDLQLLALAGPVAGAVAGAGISRVLVTCDVANLTSRGVIGANGGKLEGEFAWISATNPFGDTGLRAGAERAVWVFTLLPGGPCAATGVARRNRNGPKKGVGGSRGVVSPFPCTSPLEPRRPGTYTLSVRFPAPRRARNCYPE